MLSRAKNQRYYNIYVRQEIPVQKWDQQRSRDNSQMPAVCTFVKFTLRQ